MEYSKPITSINSRNSKKINIVFPNTIYKVTYDEYFKLLHNRFQFFKIAKKHNRRGNRFRRHSVFM